MVNIETLENKVKKLNAELDHFRNIESNEKSINEMKECIEEMEEQVEICEELVDEFEPRIETLEKSEVVIKEDIKTINDKINTTNEKVTTLDSEIKSVNNKVNNIEVYNDSEIKKDLWEQKTQLKQASLDIKKLDKQKADKEHKHVIDDIEWLPAFLEDIKNKPNWPVAVWWYTKWVRSIVAWTWITIDETDPRHPIINSTWWGWSSSLEVTQNAHWFVDLDWLYYDSSDSTFKKAQADSISTLWSWHVVEIVDANTFKVAKDWTHAITNALALWEYVLSDTTAWGYTQTVPWDLWEYVLYWMEVISSTEVSFYTSTAVEVWVEVEWNWTANQITYWTDSSTLWALDTATYPNLTELSYVKWVTSSIQTQLNAVVNAMIYKGNRDASAWTFPWAWVAQIGWFYTVSVWGTVNSVVFNVWDRLVATTNNASTTVYSWNWTQLDATDAVTSVNGQTWNVTWLQEIATVISWNTTASNDWVYVVTASATFTDPTPAEWKWYKVTVRNGTATIWWTGYAVAWSEILRIYHSWAWANYLKTPSSWVNTGDQTTIVWITGTIAQFNTALTDWDFATLAWSETLTNKTLTSPTLTTPALWTPASWNLSSCTADWTDAVWFRNIPQNSKSAAYTTVLADSGKHIYHPSADTTARTFTIDSNANVPYPIGTAITFINDTSAWVVTIAITSDTLVLSPWWTTGSRTLAANWMATAVKVTSTRRIISWSWLT